MNNATRRLEVRDRLVRAARRVGAERGLELRMEEVAIEAGVSRRTAFRYFPNRAELVNEAFAHGMHSYRKHVPLEMRIGDDPDIWLARLCRSVHDLNGTVGKLYWDLILATDVDREIQNTIETHKEHRRVFIRRCCEVSWHAYGGKDEPPPWLVDAFFAQLSPFTTVYFTDQLGRSISDVGTVTGEVLQRLVRSGVAEPDAARIDDVDVAMPSTHLA
ncbi:MAG TPA: helix-turn-helix domain-containing protein [Jatrophihabitantaceae bacterium]|nr:helix-turn-helix domain-containing protein [Jatrophihabitantaceae bacterium]